MSYIGVLNAFYTELALLGMIFTGWVLRFAGVFKLPALVALNKFVFYICLLSTLSSLDWNFTACFFIIRAAAAVFWLIWTLVTKGSIGDFVIHWMSTTWINTIIFGVPILAAIFSPAETAPLTPAVFALRYAVLASISSFFFQLPVQLILLELHRRRTAQAALKQDVEAPAHPSEAKLKLKKTERKVLRDRIAASSGIGAFFLRLRLQMSLCWNWYLRSKTTTDSSARSIVVSILLRIFTNGPILGILLGFIWAAFQPSNKPPITIDISAKPIDEFVTNFANAVTPAAAVATGIFLFDNPFKRVWKRIIIYKVFKFVVLPAAMIPLLMWLNIRGAAAQAAIVLTAMPIAISAFSLAKQYDVGTDETSTSITVGTLLMAPATLAWLAIILSGLKFAPAVAFAPSNSTTPFPSNMTSPVSNFTAPA